MKKKILVQLFLFSLFLFLSIFTYYKYFNKEFFDEELQNVKKTIPDKNLPLENLEKNLIIDLSYFSVDDEGNKYEITSEFGEIGPDDPDIILMTNVKATITIYNTDPIIITSNFAKYNVKNYDTNFKENILVKHADIKLYQNNLMLMYNNIIYQNPDTKLFADKLEIDLITKDSKIIMNDKKSKIKIIRKN